ncbi:6-N-hydroxylaminopurine resistance protein [Polystyrenella longa]|uniref:6-N-hydroxylaminopurine resistance protein n=1 Tax=Polystyrenella longa TaxID=2528007 RepID=A0A518CM08_9PLAN|nr:DUF3565 domain-containing protein [Polystyrenella longa]QDU80252.1 6-N-hydroxylaminopurine resistance protein [Polystyrenella longa]
MQQPVIGYHQDEEKHWVAELGCGHNQHVRHDPPWMIREWVTSPEGREKMLGHQLNCVKCDEQAPVDERPAVVISIQVGKPQLMDVDNPWTSGFIKEPTMEPTWLGATNLDGDEQADLVHHGGPDKAVCVYSAVHYSYWNEQLALPEMNWGAFGENFTVSQLTEQDVCIGDIWSVGETLLQVSQPRQPCWKLARRWEIKDLALQVQKTGYTGWYFRVLKEGWVLPLMPIQLVERLHEQWTIAAANQVMHDNKTDWKSSSQLGALEELSSSWKKTLAKRVDTGQQPDESRRLGLG